MMGDVKTKIVLVMKRSIFNTVEDAKLSLFDTYLVRGASGRAWWYMEWLMLPFTHKDCRKKSSLEGRKDLLDCVAL